MSIQYKRIQYVLNDNGNAIITHARDIAFRISTTLTNWLEA